MTGYRRRLFIADLTLPPCSGSARASEVRSGWGRARAAKGMRERATRIRCLDNFAGRRRPSREGRNPPRAPDFHGDVGPRTQADPELELARR